MSVPAMLRSDRGSGSVLALAIVGSIVFLTAAVVALAGAVAAQRRAAAAADASALAAADVATGRMPGEPCEVAAAIATANGAVLQRCTVEEVVVTVSASVPYAGLDASASARAGPPGTP